MLEITNLRNGTVLNAVDILTYVADGISLPVHMIPDGGFPAGTPEDEVKGILVTWLASPEVLRYTAARGLNLVICHEPLYWDEREESPLYRSSGPYRNPLDRKSHPNNLKKKIIEENNLTVLHIHYSLDKLIIYDAFSEKLGLKEVAAGEMYEKVYSLPEKMSFRKLVENVRERINLPVIRYVGDENRIIEKVGNCWGGAALSSNRYFTRRMIENGAEAIICGELDEAAMFFALEYGVCLIETSHVLSENPGIKEFADDLRRSFGSVPVEFFEIKIPYKIYEHGR